MSYYTLSSTTVFPEIPNSAQYPSYVLWSEMFVIAQPMHNPCLKHIHTSANIYTRTQNMLNFNCMRTHVTQSLGKLILLDSAKDDKDPVKIKNEFPLSPVGHVGTV